VANTSLKHVDVSSCDMTPNGIQYLARNCLPYCGGSGRTLKSLVLFDGSNKNKNYCVVEKEEDDRTTSIVYAAIESGLQSNVTLESLGELPDDNAVITMASNKNSIRHLMNLNLAGRRAFQRTVDDDLPLAAWSYVLARAGRIEYNENDDDDDEDKSDKNDNNKVSPPTATATAITATASVLFALLQGAALLEQRR